MGRLALTSLLLFLAASALGGPAAPDSGAAAPQSFIWPGEPPRGCPFERSKVFDRVAFLPRCRAYFMADTWYPSWAADGHMYSGWTDGGVNDLMSGSAEGPNAQTGASRIIGDDPLALKFENSGVHKSSALPYCGRYPSAYLVHNGIFYYGTYCLDIINSPAYPHKWPASCSTLALKKPFDHGPDLEGFVFPYAGPFVGFRVSNDYGKTWTETPHTPEKPLFPDPPKPWQPTKIVSPHFVDFGKNMERSPDGKAYLVAHGAVDNDRMLRPNNASWINGDAVYLFRVTPSPETINDAKAYEFYAGQDASGEPRWTRDFSAMKPLLEWNNHMGCVTVTYDAPLKKYLMAVTDGTDTLRAYHSYILEADRLTGPWRLVAYLKNFGEQAYFLHFPSKFIGADGATLFLGYSANHARYVGLAIKANLPAAVYGLNLQEIKLLRCGEKTNLTSQTPTPTPTPVPNQTNPALGKRRRAALLKP